MGTPEFHLEIGGVYERFQAPEEAADHYLQAAQAASQPRQRVLAYLALGRVREAQGDAPGAAAALELALADSKTAGPGGTVAGPGAAVDGGAEVAERLARLYLKQSRYPEALRLAEEQSLRASDGWQRERLARLVIEIHRSQGTLNGKIAELETAAGRNPPDESALQLLAIAHGDGAYAQQPGAAGLDKEIHVYEELLRLHPEQSQTRQHLQRLLERAGRVEDAIAIATAMGATGGDCVAGPGPVAASPRLRASAEAVRIRMRAAQNSEALALTTKLVGQAGAEAVSGRLIAAQLYREQDRLDLADQALDEAATRAVSLDDARRVAFAREQGLQNSGRIAQLESLYAEWARSSDTCLAQAAERHQRERRMSASVSAPPVRPPPSVPR